MYVDYEDWDDEDDDGISYDKYFGLNNFLYDEDDEIEYDDDF